VFVAPESRARGPSARGQQSAPPSPRALHPAAQLCSAESCGSWCPPLRPATAEGDCDSAHARPRSNGTAMTVAPSCGTSCL
jgi:hypothetical protein